MLSIVVMQERMARSVHMDRAGTAQRHAAAELRAGHAEHIAQAPTAAAYPPSTSTLCAYPIDADGEKLIVAPLVARLNGRQLLRVMRSGARPTRVALLIESDRSAVRADRRGSRAGSRHRPPRWKPRSISALILPLTFWDDQARAMKASHSGAISASGGRLATSTRRLVSAIACLSKDAIRHRGASTKSSSSASGKRPIDVAVARSARSPRISSAPSRTSSARPRPIETRQVAPSIRRRVPDPAPTSPLR